eukprot:TRINITY_DN2962_c0_g1_i1.p1 TRINITY_DN2962_c0_g1~~TRINITY_DN2962_c0_g1_i1.p1  ORF type:complete len:130 (+),score=16.64 TRINITY_DN2962_c0_g1_i1:89-478(+)
MCIRDRYNPDELDYGHVMVIEHDTPQPIWALYGHLSARSLEGKAPGDCVDGGQLIAWLGEQEENGGWPPHLHFQLSVVTPITHDMPGVVSDSQHAQALRDYPDPRMVLGPLYERGGLIESTVAQSRLTH